ncbi:pre-mRNA-splicing factor SLU7-like [Ornithodoros turicata]
MNRPVSEIIKSKDSDEPKKQSREDWRKAKELEEARKAGTAPAAVDEEGKDINPHIPQYIASAPWYFGAKGPTLKHQRPQPEKQQEFSAISDYYARGEFVGKATKYRKGACENCGSMTHKKKDCFERPRKVGAKYTGSEIAPDEKELPDLKLDYDGKRDRWNGFDSACYQGVIEEYRKVEEAKRQLKEDRLKHDIASVDTTHEDDSDDDMDGDEDKYADNADMPGTKVDSKQRITVRNLRIREDVAKYLRNLDPNSAYYDPKTRSMRDNPYKNSNKTPEELHFAGDNFVRYTGDTKKVAEAQLFAWQAYDKGVDVHLQADPTKAELLSKEFLSKKEEFRHSMKESIMEKYGGAQHLQAPPKELIFAQTEDYVEFSRHGEIIKGGEKPIIRSKYEEDILINNHTTVWGSYWKDGNWGYKCCYSFVKNSYCTGTTGQHIESTVDNQIVLNESSIGEDASAPLEEKQKRKKKKKQKRNKKQTAKHPIGQDTSNSSSEEEEEERKQKIKEAMQAIDHDQDQELDERKRKYNSMYEAKAPTEEEMEAFFIKRKRAEDPMASFLS